MRGSFTVKCTSMYVEKHVYTLCTVYIMYMYIYIVCRQTQNMKVKVYERKQLHWTYCVLTAFALSGHFRLLYG